MKTCSYKVRITHAGQVYLTWAFGMPFGIKAPCLHGTSLCRIVALLDFLKNNFVMQFLLLCGCLLVCFIILICLVQVLAIYMVAMHIILQYVNLTSRKANLEATCGRGQILVLI